ncbi:MAG: hypothetical protein LUF00_13605 [Lachnospiraceae bacterium]|nr:hypothetical protein [Lachnospiraceae bacterium]
MERLYLLDVREENGLFVYGRDEEMINSFGSCYEVIHSPVENMSSLDDMVITVLDEEPDLVVIRTEDNCAQLEYAAAKRLVKEKKDRLWIISKNVKSEGMVNIDGQICAVAPWPTDLPLNRSSQKEYATEDVFRSEISYVPAAASVLKNGVEAFITGCYPDSGRMMNLKHLYFEEEPEHFPKFSDELFDVNSALIYPDYNRNRFHDQKQTENGVYMHIHQMKKDRLYLDNFGDGEPVSIMKYAKYNGKPSVFLKIEDKEDIKALLADVDIFKQTGKTSKLGIRLVNECAWGISPCVLSGLLRGRTDRSLAFRPCLGCSTSVGSVEDDNFTLARKAALTMRQEKIGRGCGSCEMEAICSKCSMLPDGLTAEEYCETFRYSGTSDFLFKSIVVGSIFGESQKLKGDFRMVEISSPYRRLVATEKELSDKPKKRKRSILVAIRIGNQYYVLGYKNSRLYQTDERFVYLSELFDSDVPADDIVERYGNRYSLTRTEAGEHVMEAYEMIKDAVII